MSFRAATKLVALLATVSLLASCGPADAQEGDAETNQPVEAVLTETSNVRQVRVVEATSGALTARRSTSVTVEPGREARVAAGTSGQVEEVVVREGGAVEAGDPVIRLVDSNLRLQLDNARLNLQTARVNLEAASRASVEGEGQAAAALEAARSNLELLTDQLDQTRELFELGAVSSSELAGLEAQVAQARSTFLQAQDALDRSQRAGTEELELRRLQVEQAQNSLAQARLALDEAVIDAPFAGTIATVLVEQGEFIGAGSPAFRLVSNERQRVRFSVPPSDAAALLEQGLIHVPYAGLSYAAQITNSANVPGDSRLVELTAIIYPSETRIPNGAVTQLSYDVTLGEGVTVPVAALGTRQGMPYLMVAQDGQVVETPVDVLAESAGVAVVEGVAAGSLVVEPLPPDLIDGATVELIGGPEPL